MKVDVIKTEANFSKIKDSYISLKSLPPIIVLSGKEHLFKKTFIKSINNHLFDSQSLSEMNCSIFYDKSDALQSSPIEIADTMPFISDYRLIIVYNYTQFTDRNDFLEYLAKPSKSSVLILATEASLETDPLYKASIKSKSTNISFIDFPEPRREDFVSLIKSYINKENKNITTDAIDYILDNTPLDYEVIKTDLENICSYNSEKQHIEASDIINFSHGAKNAQIFDFIDALIMKDGKKTFNIMKHLDKEAYTSIPLILLNFVTLFYLKIFPPSATLQDISKITGINQYVLSKKKKFAKNYSLNEVAFYISELAKISKFSVTSPPYVVKARFEILIFNILTRNK